MFLGLTLPRPSTAARCCIPRSGTLLGRIPRYLCFLPTALKLFECNLLPFLVRNMAHPSYPKSLAICLDARGSLVVFEGVGIVWVLVSRRLVAEGLG